MTKNQLSRHATVLGADDAGQYVQYHATRIVHWNDRTVILRSGGWWTVTTKRKMNQASQQFGLGFNVSQKDFAWLVTLPNGNTVPFVEGMRFPRPAATDNKRVATGFFDACFTP